MRDDSRNIFSIIENGIDMILNMLAFVGAYIITIAIFRTTPIVIDAPKTLFLLFVSIIISSLFYQMFNLNRPIPYINFRYQSSSIVFANLVYFGISAITTIIFADREKLLFLLTWTLCSAIISTALLLFKKKLVIYFVRFTRKQMDIVRKIIIVGDNAETANAFVKEVINDTHSGIMILGAVGRKMNSDSGCEKLGDFEDLAEILDKYKPDYAVFAIDYYDKNKIIQFVNLCDDRCVKIYFLPVIYGYFKSTKQIERIGALPLINVHSTPLDHKFNAFLKRVVDIVGSLALIILTSPIMIAAAIGVRISSPGPILFRQKRVGKMGKPFTMLKFRSMKVNSESDTAWSTGVDDRKTKFGNFIRRTSIDELPQLFNVLHGTMSLVGPRPEIPHFVEYFKNVIPLYMVKHYVKPGLTGLAQVKGLRGDTSVEERIHEDINYIENWSFGLDILILLKTPLKAINKSEKLVAEGEDSEEKKSKKILYAASNMQHINNFHTGYIKALRDEGNDVTVMARGEGADIDIPFEKKLFSSKNTACRAKIRKIIEAEKYDAIILHTSLAAFHIRLACPRRARPKIVNVVHGYLFSKDVNPIKSALLLLCEKIMKNKTDAIITMNEADYNIATKHSLTNGKIYRSRGMGASVRQEISDPEALRREFFGEDKFVMTFVGELSPRKNQKFLIEALPKIKAQIPEAALCLVGDGAEKDSLCELARSLGVADSVVFTGPRTDACDFIRASDLYVSASQIEGMPFNIIEAMGAGKTVLASKIKGHDDLIENGIDGYLYEFGNTDEFVNKILEIRKTAPLDSVKIKEKYENYEKESVFPETLLLMKEAIK